MSTDNRTKYDGANLGQPSLIIKSVGSEDMGEYSCALVNEAGKGESENVSTLEVLCKYFALGIEYFARNRKFYSFLN